jgi:squalene-hopene/tetraprenyl-beta-curcumene cyclase
MSRTLNRSHYLPLLLLALLPQRPALAGDPAGWQEEKVAAYLDQREKDWFEFSSAKRGEGATRTSCICCHTLLPYALARPVLRKRAGVQGPTFYERKLLDQTRIRVEAWADLDSARLGLLHSFSEQKKRESRGTEAVLNAAILAFDDLHRGRKTPGAVTRRAFANLWEAQARTGDQKGSWDWLDFQLEPWASGKARYFGAALAAVAVGTAPGYYRAGDSRELDASVERLRRYLKGNLASQGPYNRAWALWASGKLAGTLSREEQRKVVAGLFEKQREDGGWSLSSLGDFVRRDGSAQESGSDGYATGLVLHVLQTVGAPKDHPRIASGLAWLRKNQAATGAWRGYSLNKKRSPTTHVGKFMSDAATAYAVLALSH